jgi:hypothetical protein
MLDRADMGEYVGMNMVHETDAPSNDAFPLGGDALD